MRNTDPYQILLQYSFRLLGRKSYTEAEIADKLSQRIKRRKLAEGLPAAEKVITRLRELGYIDDKKIGRAISSYDIDIVSLHLYFHAILDSRKIHRRFLRRSCPVTQCLEPVGKTRDERNCPRALLILLPRHG